MWGAIFHGLHDVMYMSMNHDENINAFKKCGKNTMQQSFNQHFLSDTSMYKSFWDLLLEIWYVITFKLSCLKSSNHFFCNFVKLSFAWPYVILATCVVLLNYGWLVFNMCLITTKTHQWAFNCTIMLQIIIFLLTQKVLEAIKLIG
jgi:hypothetical protein